MARGRDSPGGGASSPLMTRVGRDSPGGGASSPLMRRTHKDILEERKQEAAKAVAFSQQAKTKSHGYDPRGGRSPEPFLR